MRALVLSGGGSRGAYQVGALKYLLGIEERHYDIICGSSVGALNAGYLSMFPQGNEPEAANGLVSMWRDVDDDFIYKKWFFRYLATLWRPSLYNSKPLHNEVRQRLDATKIKSSGKHLSVGAVSLYTGEYRTWSENDENIVEAVLASSAFPGVFLPVEIDNELWTDGGVRENTPIGNAIDLGATEIDVILTFPKGIPGHMKNDNTVDVVKRTIDLLTTEVFENDLKMARLYNEVLENKEIEGKRRVTINVLRPSLNLIDDPLDFDPRKIQTNMSRGHLDAKYDMWT